MAAGQGGNGAGPNGTGGQPGSDNVTNGPGDAGGNGGTSAVGSGGGAGGGSGQTGGAGGNGGAAAGGTVPNITGTGGTAAVAAGNGLAGPADGDGGGGGGGGNVGFFQGGNLAGLNGRYTGGIGGIGGAGNGGGGGGGGGAGGYGVVVGNGAVFFSTGTIIGGAGGAGGAAGGTEAVGGAGGDGGVGLFFVGGSVQNRGTITGGTGGAGGAANGGTAGSAGQAGAGIAGSNINVTNFFRNDANTGNDPGTISGGFVAGSNTAQGYAIDFTGGANTLTPGIGTLNGGLRIAGSLQVLGTVANNLGPVNNAGTFDISGTTGGTAITTLSGAGTTTLGTQTLTITAGSTTASGAINGSGGLSITGGTQTLSGRNDYTGATTITGGTLQVDGLLMRTSDVSVGAQGTLSGSGVVGAGVTVSGTITANARDFDGVGASYGRLDVASLTLTQDATFRAEIGGPESEDQYDVILVNDVLRIDGALDLRIADDVRIARDTVLTLINNTGENNTIGTFRDENGTAIAEGDTVTANGQRFTISYRDRDGNDVTLTALDNNAPQAVNDTARLTQVATAIGNVIDGTPGGGADTDFDGDTLAVTAIAYRDTQAVADGGQTSIAGRYGTLTIESDGDYSYKAGIEGRLAVGETGTDTFTYTIDDGFGGTDTATLTLTVTGTSQGTSGNDFFFLTGRATSAAGGRGSDVYVVDGAADRPTEAGNDGSDLDSVLATANYTLAGNADIELLRSLDANSRAGLTLIGNGLSQKIYGDAGANTLDGKGGLDILRGYAGRDTFVFSSKLGASNVDHIQDFSARDDTIALDAAVFRAAGPRGTLNANVFKDVTDGAALDANDRILYDRDTGHVSYDADGSGSAKAVVFAVLDTKPALTFQDFQVV